MEKLHDASTIVKNIRIKVGLVVHIALGIFLFSSEFMNAIFNNRLDEYGAGFAERVIFTFKPTVIVLFIILSTILNIMIMGYLKPLFQYLTNGKNYQQARSAAINVPWVIIIFQLVAWTVGTTAYYYLQGWDAESGIPYGFGLLLKLAVGLPSAIYTSILFNMILIPAKYCLNITHMEEHENDIFSRHRDFYAIAAVIVFITVNYSYIIYYYTRANVSITFQGFYLPLILLALFYAILSFCLIALSKKEYFIQVESVKSILKEMAAGKTKAEQRISIINFNELGETAGYVNTILDNFDHLLNQISKIAALLSESSQRLASAGQENAAYSNQQASSTAEIVSTMEDVNRFSSDIGTQVKQVEELAVQMKHGVQDGFTITQKNISKMKEVTDSYSQTISGIQKLGEQISGIWEIVKIINGIAGQVKIIAFNAALEASSAGEAGKNFEIVADEIRRLADNTVASTNEIRSKISEIQQASDMLIHSSKVDTTKIQEAWEMSKNIDNVFTAILESSETTTTSAQSMTQVVEQQINAFEQVLITSRQIAQGIQEFAGSIEEAGVAAGTLEKTVETLNTMVETSSTAEPVSYSANNIIEESEK